jgi:hypothetical protein
MNYLEYTTLKAKHRKRREKSADPDEGNSRAPLGDKKRNEEFEGSDMTFE